jgi:Ca2+-binding EF-hand superfamily protein
VGSIAISRLASRILGQYDHNHDGKIDLEKPNREVERREQRQAMRHLEHTTWSGRKLFEAADAQGNADGFVTREELEAVMRRFDTNDDDALDYRGWFWNPKQESDHFDAALGERVVSRIQIPTRNPPPLPPRP